MELSSTGRPKRKSRVNVDYKLFDNEKVDLEELAKQLAEQEVSRWVPLTCGQILVSIVASFTYYLC